MLAFPPDITFVIQLVSFFVLLLVLNRLLFQPFADLLAERSSRTEGAKAEATRDQAEAQALAQRVETELDRARSKALAEADAIRRETRERETAIYTEAKSAGAARLAILREEIAKERDQALRALREDAKTLAAGMVEAVFGPSATRGEAA